MCRLFFDSDCHAFFVSIKLDYIGHRARRCNCINVRPLFIEENKCKRKNNDNNNNGDDNKTETLKALFSILT